MFYSLKAIPPLFVCRNVIVSFVSNVHLNLFAPSFYLFVVTPLLAKYVLEFYFQLMLSLDLQCSRKWRIGLLGCIYV